MNPELPNPIRNALASPQVQDSHPSADLLSAFAERTLSAGETHRVADHLAACAECREVVFLASSVAEQVTAAPERAAIPAVQRHSGWIPRFAWVASGAVAFAIAGGILIQHQRQHDLSRREMARAVETAPQQTAPAVSRPDVSQNAAPPEELRKPAGDSKPKTSKVAPPSQSHDYAVAIKAAPPAPMQAPAVISAAPSPSAAPVPPNAIGGTSHVLKLPTATQNSFAEHQDQAAMSSLTPGEMTAVTAEALMRQRMAMKSWRVTPDGQLQHLSSAGWAAVLTGRPTKFAVVSEAPDGIWAGGTQGELLHSADGGQHWSEVALPTPTDAKHDAIVSIHFTDLLHGTVITEGGTLYASSDGGKHWQKQ